MSIDDPGLFVLYEEWRDRAAHADAPRVRRFVEEHRSMLEGDLRVDLLTRVA